MRSALRVVACVLGLAAGVTASAAAECGRQVLVASVDLQTNADRNVEFVPVTIAGSPRVMLLDTGGGMTEILPQVADELQLVRQKSDIELIDVAGKKTSDFVRASFSLGPLKSDNTKFFVRTGSNIFTGTPNFAGILAPDILRSFDLDLDFGAQKLNLIWPDHCPGKVIYWPASAVAVVPMRVLGSGHIVVPVMLDGHEVDALLDTGAGDTTLSQTVAQSTFGIVLGGPDTPKGGDLQDSPGKAVYHHVFGELGFEGVAVAHAQVALIPDIMHNFTQDLTGQKAGSHVRDPRFDEESPRMLIGMNILRHFHIYVSYREEKVYITPAAEPAATPGPAAGGGNTSQTGSTH
jgi:hypothetical protein